MDFSLKESLGILIAIVVAAIVLATFINFGLFDSITTLIEGVI